jgi:hypothetical protein
MLPMTMTGRPGLELEDRRAPVLPLVLVIGLAIGTRALIDFSTPLLPKVNGAYYLQVRSLLTHVSQEFGVKPEAWNRYGKVLFLQQTTAHAPFGPQGAGGPRFREVRLPPEAEILFEGDYFRPAVAPRPPDFYPLRRPEAP